MIGPLLLQRANLKVTSFRDYHSAGRLAVGQVEDEQAFWEAPSYPFVDGRYGWRGEFRIVCLLVSSNCYSPVNLSSPQTSQGECLYRSVYRVDISFFSDLSHS